MSSVYAKIHRIKKIHKLPIDRRKVYYEIPRNFSPDLAELIGLIFSDGYIGKYSISFYNKDNALLNRFQFLMYQFFSLDNQLIRQKQSKTIEISYYQIDVASFLNKLIQKKSTIPLPILDGDKDIKTSFLKGYFSGDGCILLSIPHKKFYNKFQIKSFLFLACRRFKITKMVSTIFTSLGYTTNVNVQGLVIHRYKDIIKFYHEIGFINNSKISDHSRNWTGFEKNQVLKYVATLLKEDKKLHILRYENRDIAIKHIQSRLRKIVSKGYKI